MKLTQENITEKSDQLGELFIELGLDVEKINPDILRKLKLLNEKTETFKDEKRAIRIARAFFKYYEKQLPDESFTENEQKTVLIGTMFTDIGKTGPKNATPEQECLILDIYGVENAIKPEKITLKMFVEKYFSDDAPNRVFMLEEMGLDISMTMRQFYNLHTKWTLEIISGDGVPLEAIAAAATHHMVEDVNPEELVGKDGRFNRYFGENVSFDRAEKLIIVLDKYDAFRRRGKKEHKETIGLLKRKIESNPSFFEDKEFKELINNLDSMILADEQIYET